MFEKKGGIAIIVVYKMFWCGLDNLVYRIIKYSFKKRRNTRDECGY